MGSDEKRWWIEASQDDWAASETLQNSGNYPLAAFHLQQASEKILKAVCLDKARPAFTHSCVGLCHKIGTIGVEVPDEVTAAARRLDPHYILSRYPNGLGGSPRDYYDVALIEELAKCARTMKSFAESLLSNQVG